MNFPHHAPGPKFSAHLWVHTLLTHGGKHSFTQSPAFTQSTAKAAVLFPCFHSHLVLVTHWDKPKHTAQHSLPRQRWVLHTTLGRLSLSTPFASTETCTYFALAQWCFVPSYFQLAKALSQPTWDANCAALTLLGHAFIATWTFLLSGAKSLQQWCSKFRKQSHWEHWWSTEIKVLFWYKN